MKTKLFPIGFALLLGSFGFVGNTLAETVQPDATMTVDAPVPSAEPAIVPTQSSNEQLLAGGTMYCVPESGGPVQTCYFNGSSFRYPAPNGLGLCVPGTCAP